MSHDDLELQSSLGMGQFGDVKLAFLKSTSCTDRIKSYIDRMKGAGESLSTCRTVAVKFLRGNLIYWTPCIHTGGIGRDTCPLY